MSEIDVSKCKRCIGKDKFCRYFKNNCDDISNERCIWKKHFRLEAENKELKQSLEKIKNIAKSLYYHSITDPVKREAATWEIVEICKGE